MGRDGASPRSERQGGRHRRAHACGHPTAPAGIAGDHGLHAANPAARSARGRPRFTGCASPSDSYILPRIRGQTVTGGRDEALLAIVSACLLLAAMPASRRPRPAGGLAQPDVPGPAQASTGPTGLSPAAIKAAYAFSTSATAGAGETIALVDAYDDPTAETDLGVFSTQFGLPACTTANGCFKKVSQTGVDQVSEGRTPAGRSRSAWTSSGPTPSPPAPTSCSSRPPRPAPPT